MKYNNLVPEDSFIGQYMKYMSVVETAESYDFWCAMWAIGVRCGRNVFVDRPNSPVYLNWYIILAAESGTTRKSTAISSISAIVRSTDTILAGKTSPESLEILLHESTRKGEGAIANFAVSELVTILGREGYMSTMPGLLTDLYDCAEERRSPGTLKSGEIIQRNVYVNFLSASTPTWLVSAINPTVIEGGFTSRVMFIVDDNRKRSIAWPESRPAEDIVRTIRLLEECTSKSKGVEGIQISKGGLTKFRQWYNNRRTHNDPFLSSFEAREDDHTLRAAACLSINEGTYEIQSSHISKAIRIINDVKSKSLTLFGGDFSQKARILNGVSRVREILLEAGNDGIKHFDLQRRIVRHMDAKEMKLLMNVMHEAGMIQIFQLQRGKMYRATRAIEAFGVNSKILASLNLSQD